MQPSALHRSREGEEAVTILSVGLGDGGGGDGDGDGVSFLLCKENFLKKGSALYFAVEEAFLLTVIGEEDTVME